MTTRRGFLSGLLAAGLVPRPSWADAGAPRYLAAARGADGASYLHGLSDMGEALFRLPLPARGHAAAAHPMRPEAVAFARRPGRFALVIDCRSGAVMARLSAPAGRHFYGHGAFSRDGARLFTAENDYDAARGRIGVWDAAHGYARIGEFASGGVGPHDILRLPGTDVFAVANGGIETHPDMGRVKLNLPTMRPNLSYLSAEGAMLDQVELDPALRLNSIRHLAARPDGLIAFAMQWQGDVAAAPPVLALHRRGQAPAVLSAPGDGVRAMRGYAGSVAFAGGGDAVAITSPKGGAVQIFSAAGAFAAQIDEPDICGLSACAGGLIATTGTGKALRILDGAPGRAVMHDAAWDNHLVGVGGA